jgi:hypothetical protein
MKKIICLISCFFVFYFTKAQEVIAIETGNLKLQNNEQKFEYVQDSLNKDSLAFVATYSITGTKTKRPLIYLFEKIKQKAIADGANCFTLEQYLFDTIIENATLILKTFYSNSTLLHQNMVLQEQNMIYVFGDEKYVIDNYLNFKLNGKTIKLGEGKYFKIKREQNKELIVSKGFNRAYFSFILKDNKPNLYMQLTDDGPMPSSVESTKNITINPVFNSGSVGVGVNINGVALGLGTSFRKATIVPLQTNFGCLMQHIFTKTAE